MNMNKKWFLMMTSILFAVMISVGCNANPDPAPPDDDVIENGDNVPGVDKNDTIMDDDENDSDPDSEDIIEDPEDIGDRDNRDE
jgi:hypothetical protein